MTKLYDIGPCWFDSEEYAIAQALIDFGYGCIGEYSEDPEFAMEGDVAFKNIQGWEIASSGLYLQVVHKGITYILPTFDVDTHVYLEGNLKEIWVAARETVDLVERVLSAFSGKYVQLSIFKDIYDERL